LLDPTLLDSVTFKINLLIDKFVKGLEIIISLKLGHKALFVHYKSQVGS
jgi:hypothetical protein